MKMNELPSKANPRFETLGRVSTVVFLELRGKAHFGCEHSAWPIKTQEQCCVGTLPHKTTADVCRIVRILRVFGNEPADQDSRVSDRE